MSLTMLKCSDCKHIDPGRTRMLVCEAFPGGIPEEILTGDVDHGVHFPGDHGILFEPSEAVAQFYRSAGDRSAA